MTDIDKIRLAWPPPPHRKPRGMNVSEPSELNLWTRQWRSELIGKARADFRKRDSAWQCLKDKSTDYARSIKMARDVSAQVLAVWESSPVDLAASPAPSAPAEPTLDELMAVVRLYGKSPTPHNEFKVRATLRDALSAPAEPAQQTQAGWKLVPVEPTDEMLIAGQEAWVITNRARNAVEDCTEAEDVYRAMLAAAPAPEGVPQNTEGVPAVHLRVTPCKHCGARQGEEHSVTCPYGVGGTDASR